MNFFSGHFFSIYRSMPMNRDILSHIPTYYGIQYNHSGRFFLEINHQNRQILEGPHVFITHPHAHFHYGTLPGETRHHNYICSYGERVEQYIRCGLLPLEERVYPVAEPELFLDLMLRIMDLLRQSAPLVPPRAVLLYEELLLLLSESRTMNFKIPPFHREDFLNLTEMIRRNPQRTWNFAMEAKKRQLTLTHFRRLFKVISGESPQQFLIHCRLEHAAHLLLTTGESVGTIADLCGIENEFYFSRLFRKRYHIPPAKFRRERE